MSITVSSPRADTSDDTIPTGDQVASSGVLVRTSTSLVWTGDIPVGGVVTITTGSARLGRDAPEVAAGEVPQGDYLSLVVADAGTGMPPEVLDRAIEPFFTTKHNGPGSGLGLSTVYGFAQQSRGHLLLRSQPGRGTSVRLLFPCFAVPATWRPEPDG